MMMVTTTWFLSNWQDTILRSRVFAINLVMLMLSYELQNIITIPFYRFSVTIVTEIDCISNLVT